MIEKQQKYLGNMKELIEGAVYFKEKNCYDEYCVSISKNLNSIKDQCQRAEDEDSEFEDNVRKLSAMVTKMRENPEKLEVILEDLK